MCILPLCHSSLTSFLLQRNHTESYPDIPIIIAEDLCANRAPRFVATETTALGTHKSATSRASAIDLAPPIPIWDISVPVPGMGLAGYTSISGGYDYYLLEWFCDEFATDSNLPRQSEHAADTLGLYHDEFWV